LICLLSQSIICWLESRLFCASSSFYFNTFIYVLISLISASFLSSLSSKFQYALALFIDLLLSLLYLLLLIALRLRFWPWSFAS
jgi:hypothetical protein